MKKILKGGHGLTLPEPTMPVDPENLMVGITSFILEWPICMGQNAVSFRECNEGKFPSFMPSPSSPFSWLFVPPGGRIPTVGVLNQPS